MAQESGRGQPHSKTLARRTERILPPKVLERVLPSPDPSGSPAAFIPAKACKFKNLVAAEVTRLRILANEF